MCVSQDKADDREIGIGSTALLFGDRSRQILSACSVTSIACVAYAGIANGQGPLFFTGVGLAAAQLARVVKRTDFDNEQSCWDGFVGCGWSGFWVWMGALADFLVLGTSLW